MPGSNPAERAAVYDAMNETLARLHSFEPAAIGLGDFGRGENYVARQVDRWSKQYRASETEKIDEMERLIEWLPAHIPPAGPVRLVHGDYRLDNMILHAERAEGAGGARLGALHHRRSARRLHLSPDAMAHAAEDTGAGTGSLVGFDLPALGIPSLCRLCRDVSRPHQPRSAAASAGLSRPTISSASPRSCKASSVACATAPPPARTPPAQGADGAAARRRWPGVRAARRAPR